jgi:hypothetical protein
MDSDLKHFIENNIDLIEDNEWSKVYLNALSRIPVGILTEALLKARINPLNYLDYIPEWYLAHSDIEEFEIPDGVDSIGEGAFYGCKKLKKLIIPSTIKDIEGRIITFCNNLTNIVFKGTKEEFYNIEKDMFWLEDFRNPLTIHCTDGDMDYSDK